MFITIITTVYNRIDRIGRLYASLCRQSVKCFEWLVIDDGSTDGLNDYISGIQKEENDFQIKYHFQNNGGKHRALNAAHPFISGEWMTVVDSDDYLVDDAVENIQKVISETNPKHNIGGGGVSEIICWLGVIKGEKVKYRLYSSLFGDYESGKRY